jgi:esterase/lipase superfamily enzyme
MSSPGGGPPASAIARNNNPSSDFVTTGRWELDEASFKETVDRMEKGDDNTVVVFVHGYNTSYQEAVFRLAQLDIEAGARAVPILFSWPSQADFRGYVADRDSTTYARDDLVRLLTMLSRSRSQRRVAVIGHSMGAWLVMEALRQLRLQGRNDVVAHLQVGLSSPDIDVDVFRKQAAVVGRLSPPLTVLISRDDRALAISSRLAGGRPRLGLASADDPRIQEIARQNGVQIIDITSLPSTDRFNHNRFVALAARYSAAAQKGARAGGVRQAGVFLLDATGRILSAPFEQTARMIAGSR